MQKRNMGMILGTTVVVLLISVFYCLFLGNHYIVQFDTAGGSKVDKVSVQTGEMVLKPEEPTREGYEFLGWYLDEEPYDFESPVRKNITLVAKWRKIATAEDIFYVVTFNSDGGSEVESQYVTPTSKVSKPTEPIKKGYEFLGWYYKDTKFDFSKSVSQNIELVAKWEKED